MQCAQFICVEVLLLLSALSAARRLISASRSRQTERLPLQTGAKFRWIIRHTRWDPGAAVISLGLSVYTIIEVARTLLGLWSSATS